MRNLLGQLSHVSLRMYQVSVSASEYQLILLESKHEQETQYSKVRNLHCHNVFWILIKYHIFLFICRAHGDGA